MWPPCPDVAASDVSAARSAAGRREQPTSWSLVPKLRWWRARRSVVGDGLLVFGPAARPPARGQQGVLPRQLAAAAGVPMAEGASFSGAAERCEFAAGWSRGAVKADGLAAGKGVTVCDDTGARRRPPSAALGPDADRRTPLEGREVSRDRVVRRSTALALPAGTRPQARRRWRQGTQHRRHGRLLAPARPRRGQRRAPARRLPPAVLAELAGAVRHSGAPCTRA